MVASLARKPSVTTVWLLDTMYEEDITVHCLNRVFHHAIRRSMCSVPRLQWFVQLDLKIHQISCSRVTTYGNKFDNDKFPTSFIFFPQFLFTLSYRFCRASITRQKILPMCFWHLLSENKLSKRNSLTKNLNFIFPLLR